jgi:hypothetical protein
MAAIKTQKNDASVAAFLKTFTEQKQQDCKVILNMMQQVSKEAPKMWGSSIIGFGSYHYKSERSKQEGDWFITGFSPRKANLTLYIMPSINTYKEIVARLGKCKTSVSCLYINKLADVDLNVLKELVATAYENMNES